MVLEELGEGDRRRIFTLLMEAWSPIETELMDRLQRGEVDAVLRTSRRLPQDADQGAVGSPASGGAPFPFPEPA
jgi:hypothetical protein